MSADGRDGIVHECFAQEKIFPTQLVCGLPTVLLVFVEARDAFVGELTGGFSKGDAGWTDPVAKLLEREVTLNYGTRPDGTVLGADVIFAPHPTGDPIHWAAARPKVVQRLQAAAAAARPLFRPRTGHLSRTTGSRVFCSMRKLVPVTTCRIQPLAHVPVVGPQPRAAAPPFGSSEICAEQHAHRLRQQAPAGVARLAVCRDCT